MKKNNLEMKKTPVVCGCKYANGKWQFCNKAKELFKKWQDSGVMKTDHDNYQAHFDHLRNTT